MYFDHPEIDAKPFDKEYGVGAANGAITILKQQLARESIMDRRNEDDEPEPPSYSN